MAKKSTTINSAAVTATVIAERVTAESGISDEHLPAVVAYLAQQADTAMDTARVEMLRRAEEATRSGGNAERLAQVMSTLYGEDAVRDETPGRSYLQGWSERDVKYYIALPEGVTYGAGPGPFRWVALPEATEPAAEEDLTIRY